MYFIDFLTKIKENRYTSIKEIFNGSLSQVFEAFDRIEQEGCIIKLIFNKQLYENEMAFYDKLNNQEQTFNGVPRFIQTGKLQYQINKIVNYIVIEKVGITLQEFMEQNNNILGYQIDQRNIAMIAKKILLILQQIHQTGFFHKDIKIDNILFQNDLDLIHIQNNDIYIIDFGLCQNRQNPAQKQYIFPDNQQRKYNSYNNQKQFKIQGNINFISTSYSKYKIFTYKDDLESWFYTIVYLSTRTLPWIRQPKDTLQEYTQMKEKYIKNLKICQNMPKNYKEIINYIFGLKLNEIPNYSFILELLDEIILKDPINEKEISSYNKYNFIDMPLCYKSNNSFDLDQILGSYLKDLQENSIECQQRKTTQEEKQEGKEDEEGKINSITQNQKNQHDPENLDSSEINLQNDYSNKIFDFDPHYSIISKNKGKLKFK